MNPTHLVIWLVGSGLVCLALLALVSLIKAIVEGVEDDSNG